MNDDSTRQSVLFSDLLDKTVIAKFDQEHASSDGGAILLQACDRRLGLTDALIGAIDDRRQSGKIRHAIGDLVRQRLYAIGCGYPDANDASRLGSDPIHKLLCDVKRITIDLDPTDDPTHGAQQLTFFNGHYDTWCYLPVAGFLTFNEEPEQYLFAYVLRPGNVGASVGALGILSRLLPKLRAAFPRARLRVRLDGGFAAPQIFAFLDREGVEYAVAMGKNKVLERRAARLMGTAQRLSRESGETEHLYKECRYAAGTWDYPRRVVIKAEVVRHPGRKPKNNPRFVVTNLKQSPQHLYEVIYCARANVENRIKELHHGLEIDRTSCTRFLANQLRGLLTAAAYVLYQELHLRAACIHRNDWQIIARSLGAAPA